MGANIDSKAEYLGPTYRWRCPACGNITEEEWDPRNHEVGCDHCPWEGLVQP